MMLKGLKGSMFSLVLLCSWDSKQKFAKL
jgi:hypothetical protein